MCGHGHIWVRARACRLRRPLRRQDGFLSTAIFLLVGGTAVLSACGGSGSTAKTMTPVELRAQYTSIVTPIQQAEGRYVLSGRAAIPSLQSALQSAQSALLRITWPGRTETDIRGLVSTFSAIDTQLQLQRTDPAAASSQAFSEFLSAEHTDSSNVRTDLELPITATSP
jgi:hypothetical protein